MTHTRNIAYALLDSPDRISCRSYFGCQYHNRTFRAIYSRSPAVRHENLGDEQVARIGRQFKGLPAISAPVISY